ncbi:MAG: ATP-dependent DNA ligase, partial [Nocardioides kribbensis]
MLLADVVATSEAVAATRSRKAKVEALAALLRRLDHARPDEVDVVVTYLAGSLRQRRTGLGWRSVADLPPPAQTAGLDVVEVDRAFAALSALAGPGSQSARAAAVADLFGRADAAEQAWLRGAVTGEVRQGALAAVVQEAVVAVAQVQVADVRR